MQHRGYKMIYIISGIFGILIVLFMIKGCSYPTSYRAFIPKALDSEYKEYQRLCKEEIGKVLYARPAGEGTRVEDIRFAFPYSLVSDSIRLRIVSVSDEKKLYISTYKLLNIIQAGQKKAFQCTATINNVYDADLLKILKKNMI